MVRDIYSEEPKSENEIFSFTIKKNVFPQNNLILGLLCSITRL